MKTQGNTILITGGGSGIGKALAEAFCQRGNHVIIAGRRQSNLQAVAEANPGIDTLRVDLSDHEDITRFATEVSSRFPDLNVVIHCAGIMQTEDWCADKVEIATAEATIATNLLAPIRLTAALLPLLRKNAASTLINVSSGLAFIPLAVTPTYCATKAAIHSLSESLRFQLKDTGVGVVEIAPPYVQTELMGDKQANDPMAMPLKAFIEEVMTILDTEPEVEEVLVKNVFPLRYAAEQGPEGYRNQFYQFNEHFVP